MIVQRRQHEEGSFALAEEEEEPKTSPEASKASSWETKDSYLPLKMMGRGPRVDPDDDAQSKVSDMQQASIAALPMGNLVFTLDDIPYSKWPDKLQEFLAYLT
ncbi:hypothetical protein CDL15_Pgr011836 [Punica granatum]|uniref:Uncharacterized protein n=1 Tax=Punica granatum TaxID=22663 RepID=A0A218XDY2_PUNGR|nr:hypothetical protein CDL15_Pgr011836 [Punica granatum]